MPANMLPPLLAWILFIGVTLTRAGTNETFDIMKATAISKPGCPSVCGNLTVPYPFGVGIGRGCALHEGFELNCSDAFHPPRALIENIQIYEISDSRLRISNVVAMNCYDISGNVIKQNTAASDVRETPFSYSDLNKFTIVGCDDFALLSGRGGRNQTNGCVSICSGANNVTDGECSGKGCCQTSIAKGTQLYLSSVASLNNHTTVSSFNPCGYGFLGESTSFIFQATDLSDPNFAQRVRTTVPIVLDWAIGNSSCAKVMNSSDYACKANSHCVDSDTGVGGYRCSCNRGYQGNPYLQQGCIVDKCWDPNLNDCEKICVSSVGSFSCSCPDGEFGDGRKNGTGCTNHRFPITKLALGVGFGVLSIVIAAACLYYYSKRSSLRRRREKFFKRNGGFILKQRISLKDEGSIESTRIFTAKELKTATNGYERSRIIGKGGYGTVYKGILPDKSIVAIKKSTVMDETQIEQFINEVIILGQINHRNVVKLLGFCLESEVPILVYEYISNGTLFDHIHSKETASLDWLSWENRLRIASEVAGALSYLHSAASTPIIHRDVKSTNILVDEYYTAKISDFGASRLIPLEKTKVTTLVIGTFGYLDPEYFHTSHLTEKSDVYSFGVVLIELMTGEKPVDMGRSEEQRSLTAHFITSMNENRLFQILESRVVREGPLEQLQAMGELIKKCLHLSREERPTMKEVAAELEALRKLTGISWSNQQAVGLMNEISESTDLYDIPIDEK